MKRPISSYIDHTLLKAVVTSQEIISLCKEAKDHHFAAVCVPPYLVDVARKELGDENKVALATVVAFPLGYNDVSTKISECKNVMDDGADEIDAVVNISAIKSNNWDLIKSEIDSLATTIGMKDKVFKLIFETCLLTEDEIAKLCELCIEFNIDYAKTSTGFSSGGATLEVVNLMHEILHGKVKIKASGGIRTLEQVKAYIAAGADRIGTSSGLEFI